MTFYQGRPMDVDDDTATGMDSKAAARSCTTCSKAKAKCVRRPGQEICERCARLRKECHSREPVLRRRKVVKTTRAAQLEKLEHKIEHLVNALSTSQAQRGYSVDHGQLSPPISQHSDVSSYKKRSEEVLSSLCESMDDESQDPPISIPSTSPSSTALYATTSQATSPEMGVLDYQTLGVNLSEAEILLDRFRRLMAYNFPFVVVPTNATAKQLLAEKPLLLHSIVTVTYFHDYQKQQIMLKHLMRDISERTLINNEKSVDVLQGILVLVAWYHPHVFSTQQATNLLHLAQALTVDLQIDRPPFQCEGFKHAQAKMGHPPPKQPTLEEHRALAGTFYLNSMLASSFKKVESMRYSNYLDNALNLLEQTREYETDLFLVQMVRLQHLMDDASKTETPSAPMQMYVKAFTVDLDRLKKNDPCKDTCMDNVFLRLQYLAAEIVVWELSLNDLQDNNQKPLRSHLDDLCQCVKAIKAFIDVFFTIPVSSYLTLPFSFFGQFGHAFISLIKLASLEVDGWDMSDLNDEFNFVEVIEEIAKRYEGGSKAGPDGLAINNESFAKWAHRVRFMKSVYEAKFVQESGETTEDRSEAVKAMWTKPPVQPETPAQQQPTPPDDVLSGDFFNYLDEGFWQSFAGDFEFGFPEMTMT